MSRGRQIRPASVLMRISRSRMSRTIDTWKKLNQTIAAAFTSIAAALDGNAQTRDSGDSPEVLVLVWSIKTIQHHTSDTIISICLRSLFSVLINWSGSLCIPTQQPFTNIFVALKYNPYYRTAAQRRGQPWPSNYLSQWTHQPSVLLCNGRRGDLIQVLHTPLFQELQDRRGMRTNRDIGHQRQILHQTDRLTLQQTARVSVGALSALKQRSRNESIVGLPRVSLRGISYPTECCAADAAWPTCHLYQLANSICADGKVWKRKSDD